MECEDDWGHNKKLIDTRGRKKLTECIPKNFPFFHVDFGLQGGFAHVLEVPVMISLLIFCH